MPLIKKRSLVDQVYERLRSDIISLALPLGSRVNVNELQESLGVSCTPIREAINRLQQEGLISYENNVGARVLTLDDKDVEEITQLSTTLHCAAARLAMVNTDHQVLIQELEGCIQAFVDAQTSQQQSESIHQFMSVFYAHCGNRRLDKSMLAIQGQQLLLRNLYVLYGMDREATLQDLRSILSGVENNDPPVVHQSLSTAAQRVAQAACQALKQRK